MTGSGRRLTRTSAVAVRGAERVVDRWLMAALAVTAMSLVLGLVGIGYGLPFHYHWDEPTIMNRAIRMGGGDLNPHFYTYPTLVMYVMLAAQGVLYAVGRALHAYASSDAFLVSYLNDSTASYIVGRAVIAVTGGATVLVTFLVGRRFISPAAGLLGAAILAVSPLLVSNSHFVTNDVPVTFLATLSFLPLWNVYRRGSRRDYVQAGLVIGLAVSAKYLPVLLLFSLGLAHALRLREAKVPLWSARQAGPLLMGGAAAFAAFALTSPFVVLDWRAAIDDYRVQAGLSAAAGCSSCSFNFVPYLTQTLGWAVGWPVYLLALVGLASIGFVRGDRRNRFLLLASWPVLLFLVVGVDRQSWARYLVPIAPFASLSAAAVSLSAWRRIANFIRRLPVGLPAGLARTVAVAIGLGALLIPSEIASVRYDASLLQQDPRTAAVSWFTHNVPSGTTVAVQPLLDRYFLTAQLPTEGQLAIEDSWIPPARTNARTLLDTTYRSGPVYKDATFLYDYDQLVAEGVRYVIISSAHYHAVDPAAEDRLYAQLRQQAVAIRTFAPSFELPDAQNYPVSAPVIVIYQLA